jgi:hypothetical protein
MRRLRYPQLQDEPFVTPSERGRAANLRDFPERVPDEHWWSGRSGQEIEGAGVEELREEMRRIMNPVYRRSATAYAKKEAAREERGPVAGL